MKKIFRRRKCNMLASFLRPITTPNQKILVYYDSFLPATVSSFSFMKSELTQYPGTGFLAAWYKHLIHEFWFSILHWLIDRIMSSTSKPPFSNNGEFCDKNQYYKNSPTQKLEQKKRPYFVNRNDLYAIAVFVKWITKPR